MHQFHFFITAPTSMSINFEQGYNYLDRKAEISSFSLAENEPVRDSMHLESWSFADSVNSQISSSDWTLSLSTNSSRRQSGHSDGILETGNAYVILIRDLTMNMKAARHRNDFSRQTVAWKTLQKPTGAGWGWQQLHLLVTQYKTNLQRTGKTISRIFRIILIS